MFCVIGGTFQLFRTYSCQVCRLKKHVFFNGPPSVSERRQSTRHHRPGESSHFTRNEEIPFPCTTYRTNTPNPQTSRNSNACRQEQTKERTREQGTGKRIHACFLGTYSKGGEKSAKRPRTALEKWKSELKRVFVPRFHPAVFPSRHHTRALERTQAISAAAAHAR